MGWRWFVVALAGCGRISFADEHRGADAMSASPDGSVAGTCDLSAPFEAPIAIAELNTSSDDAIMRLTPDELTTVFYRTSTSDQFMIATRADRTSPFGAPVALASLNTSSVQEDPAISADGLAIAFRSQRAGGVGGSDLYSATRATTAAPFGDVQLIANVNSTAGDVQPFLGPDGLYFASNRLGTYDLYFAPGDLTNGYGAPAELPISSASDDEGPVISADRLAIYFASDRAGGIGGRDTWVAYRASTAVAFDPPVHVDELSSAGTDSPTWLSPDNCRMYLTRHPTGGNADLYVANR